MIVFGSRGSDLALTQSRQFATALQERTGEPFRIEVIETSGDRILDKPLAEIGGKGLFTAELEAALHEGSIDAAVHSLKDLPVDEPDGLCVGCIPRRVPANDVLVFHPRHHDAEGGTIPLAFGCRVGTSSPRRRGALRSLRPDLEIVDLRGNVPTRARKVASGELHATILAAAGLQRLGLDLGELRAELLPPRLFPSAPGQGALGVQCRRGDGRVLDLLRALHDEATATCVNAERALLARLGGGCSMPLGAFVEPAERGFRMHAALFAGDGSGNGVFHSAEHPTAGALVDGAAAEIGPFIGDPLRGRRVFLLRPGGEPGDLGSALRVAGAEVDAVALTEITPVQPEPEALGALAGGFALAFTSARAVDRWFEITAGRGLPEPGAVFAVGPATARALAARGIVAERPAVATGEGLGRHIAERIAPGTPILFPCARDRRPELERELAAAGLAATPIPLYATRPIAGVEVPERQHDVVVFTSPSAVAAYRDNQRARPGRHVAIGPATAGAMRESGVTVDAVADSPSPAALVTLIEGLRDD